MKTVRIFISKHTIISGGILFGVLSLIANGLWIGFFDMAHIYDVIHAIPTALIYEPIIQKMGGFVSTEWLFVPLALLIDVAMGIVFTAILKRWIKDKGLLGWGLIGAFAIYWIAICYQWLPIF